MKLQHVAAPALVLVVAMLYIALDQGITITTRTGGVATATAQTPSTVSIQHDGRALGSARTINFTGIDITSVSISGGVATVMIGPAAAPSTPTPTPAPVEFDAFWAWAADTGAIDASTFGTAESGRATGTLESGISLTLGVHAADNATFAFAFRIPDGYEIASLTGGGTYAFAGDLIVGNFMREGDEISIAEFTYQVYYYQAAVGHGSEGVTFTVTYTEVSTTALAPTATPTATPTAAPLPPAVPADGFWAWSTTPNITAATFTAAGTSGFMTGSYGFGVFLSFPAYTGGGDVYQAVASRVPPSGYRLEAISISGEQHDGWRGDATEISTETISGGQYQMWVNETAVTGDAVTLVIDYAN